MQCSKRPINLGAFGQVLARVLAFIALCAADVAASNVCRARVIDPVADERLWRVTTRAIWVEVGSIRARRVSGNGIVGEVHRSQSTNRLG
jgi:uncharacterized membrane protein